MLQRVCAVILLCLALPAQAEKMTEASLALCEKVKECALQQLQQENFTPEMRQMMEPMLSGMCQAVRAQITEVPTGHPLYAPALACMESMAQLSCAQLQGKDDTKTPECEEYRRQAEKYEQNQ
ncbi:MAG: hypothetical protein HKN19_03175 [Halioglobus sp.]|nr:hypothetical protein [Halioglobus sp.]